MNGPATQPGDDPFAHPLRSLRVDLERYFPTSRRWPWWRRMRRALTSPEIWILTSYRLGVWIRGLRTPLRWIPLFAWLPVNRIIATIWDTHILSSRIGPGLYLGHTGGIWINPQAQLGACCNIAQGVIVGAAGGGAETAPTLGDRVWIGPHAVVTGPIKVGSDVVIGANSLVAAPLPDHAVALGVPAKVLTYSGSAKLVKVPPSLQRWWGLLEATHGPAEAEAEEEAQTASPPPAAASVPANAPAPPPAAARTPASGPTATKS